MNAGEVATTETGKGTGTMTRGETGAAGPRIGKIIRKMMAAEIGTGEILIIDLSQEKSVVQEKILASVTKRLMKRIVTGMTSTVRRTMIRAALMTAKLRVRMNHLPKKIRSLSKINFKIQIRSPRNN
jgi:hypothetical protein